jgi:hypothetical protein
MIMLGTALTPIISYLRLYFICHDINIIYYLVATFTSTDLDIIYDICAQGTVCREYFDCMVSPHVVKYVSCNLNELSRLH